jgi:hypothetical protein
LISDLARDAALRRCRLRGNREAGQREQPADESTNHDLTSWRMELRRPAPPYLAADPVRGFLPKTTGKTLARGGETSISELPSPECLGEDHPQKTLGHRPSE